jgi:hypothetical protein
MSEEKRDKNNPTWLREWQFKPGESGNKKGRTTAGATLKEQINRLVEGNYTEEELREIAKDKTKGIAERSAANRLINMIERGDLADVEAFLNGDKTLKQLRDSGLHTDIIKKAKVVKKKFMTEGGENVEVESREIELHDRSGGEFDRISDRTEGRPTQAVDLNNTGIPPFVQVITPLTRGEASEDGDSGRSESEVP